MASAVGIVAMVIAVFLFQTDWGQWYPWTLSGVITYSLAKGARPLAELAVGSLGGVAAAFLGGWDVTRRDVLWATLVKDLPVGYKPEEDKSLDQESDQQ